MDLTQAIAKAKEQAQSIIWWSVKKPLVELGMEGYIGEWPEENDEFWNSFFEGLSNKEIEEFIEKIMLVKNEKELEKLINSYGKTNIKEAISIATADVNEKETLDMLDDIKGKNIEH